ncbi:MAG: hypothetical protein HOI28_07530 [Euryarchaeota archaeon]|jgi:hypothetical protein|nr:hypothetical protein [Euryarchaeota archaeon]MBT4925329.1 hypothetical protein [Euryarchaeota archaeon]MBT5736670.1 hypothetical protein [Euryarchaeota archaeon]
MAKKKGRLGRLFGAITGSPYERLIKQVDKLVETSEDDSILGKNLVKLVKITGQNYEEEKIDEEEHDLIVEAIEEVDPQNRVFGKVSDDEDSFYMGDSPEAPKLNLGKRKNLDQLMKSKGNEFTGSYGRDEYQEFRDKMTQDFLQESDKAVREGDHSANIGTVNRVFADADEEVQQLKKSISEETGMEDPNAEDDIPDGYSIDEDGTEWFEDEDGYWWYRLVGEEDWLPHEE